jgi:hypothetical protein
MLALALNNQLFVTFLAVLDFLSQLLGWDSGLVRCSGVALRGLDGRVCGFEQVGQQVWQDEEEIHNDFDRSELRVIMQSPVTVN